MINEFDNHFDTNNNVIKVIVKKHVKTKNSM